MASNLQLETLSASADRASFLAAFAELPGRVRDDDHRVGLAAPGATLFLMNAGLTEVREAWLARSEGRVVGRVHANVSWSNASLGYIGFYEVDLGFPDHEAVARALLEEASRWLAARGARDVYGPIDWCTTFSYRLLLPRQGKSKDSRLHTWEPVTPPAFLDHWRAAGFEVAEHYHSRATNAAPVDYAARREPSPTPAKARAEALGFTFRPLAPIERIDEDFDALNHVNTLGFADNFLFEPIPFPLYCALTRTIAGKSPYHYSSWVHAPDGEPAGYIYTFRDEGVVVRKTVAIIPKYRGAKLSSALFQICTAESCRDGIVEGVFALIREGNISDKVTTNTSEDPTDLWRHDYVLFGKKL